MKMLSSLTCLVILITVGLLLSGCEVLDRSKQAGENKRAHQKDLAESE